MYQGKPEGFGWLRPARPFSCFDLYFYSSRWKRVYTQYILFRKLLVLMGMAEKSLFNPLTRRFPNEFANERRMLLIVNWLESGALGRPLRFAFSSSNGGWA
jgi:hypothetical protein